MAALGVHAVSATAGAVLLALMMWAGPSRLPSALWGAAFIVLKVGSSKKWKTARFADLLAVQVFLFKWKSTSQTILDKIVSSHLADIHCVI